jgi:hypothetical protein
VMVGCIEVDLAGKEPSVCGAAVKGSSCIDYWIVCDQFQLLFSIFETSGIALILANSDVMLI